jgi:hypothetical protein
VALEEEAAATVVGVAAMAVTVAPTRNTVPCTTSGDQRRPT